MKFFIVFSSYNSKITHKKIKFLSLFFEIIYFHEKNIHTFGNYTNGNYHIFCFVEDKLGKTLPFIFDFLTFWFCDLFVEYNCSSRLALVFSS